METIPESELEIKVFTPVEAVPQEGQEFIVPPPGFKQRILNWLEKATKQARMNEEVYRRGGGMPGDLSQ